MSDLPAAEKRSKRPRVYFGAPKFVRRMELLERIAELATELCVAADRESEDIGGSRPSLKILQEIGPLTDELEKL